MLDDRRYTGGIRGLNEWCDVAWAMSSAIGLSNVRSSLENYREVLLWSVDRDAILPTPGRSRFALVYDIILLCCTVVLVYIRDVAPWYDRDRSKDPSAWLQREWVNDIEMVMWSEQDDIEVNIVALLVLICN